MRSYFRKIRSSSYVVIGLLAIVYFGNVMFTTSDQPSKNSLLQTNNEKKFAGSASCAGCHKDIYESHIKTAHYLDSRPASKEFIKGSFSTGKNRFVYNKWMEVLLEKKKDTYFQTSYMNGIEFQREQFDIVIGSGRKGQSYLYWRNNILYQLPISFYTPLNSWCNSPGFPTNFIKFDRIIPGQCLECHGTYAEVAEGNDSIPVYNKNSIIYGIDCERCHGPAADHVNFQKSNPREKTAKYIISSKQLDRQQRLDGCALCHSGFRKALKPAFSFMVGDKLDDFSIAGYRADSVASLDVHGNQYGLLMASKCFQMSSQLDCSSCHNVHKNEVNNLKTFSQRCITCHTDTKHTDLALSPEKKQLLKNNCIDCHMPMLPSEKITLTFSSAEKNVPDLVRTHRIAIYPEKVKEFMAKMKLRK
jgi:Cytochrome c554 and c-prime